MHYGDKWDMMKELVIKKIGVFLFMLSVCALFLMVRIYKNVGLKKTVNEFFSKIIIIRERMFGEHMR